MKKNFFVVLSLAAVLGITACNPSNGGESKSTPDASTSGGASSKTSSTTPTGSQDATGFAFNEIASTVMVEDKVKEYVNRD